jgi:hypothetical protein
MNCLEISCDPAVVNIVALAREKPAIEALGKQRRSHMEKYCQCFIAPFQSFIFIHIIRIMPLDADYPCRGR